MSTPRTDQIGSCYEYRYNGRALPGTCRMTIDQLIEHSAIWPETWHCYDDHGVLVWAKNGQEIAPEDLPGSLRVPS